MAISTSIRNRPELIEALEQYAPKVAKQVSRLTVVIRDALQALRQRLPAEVAFELAADYREIRLLGVLLQAEPSERRSLLVTEGRLDDPQADSVLELLAQLESAPRLINALAWVQPSWFPQQEQDLIKGLRPPSIPDRQSNEFSLGEKKIFSWLHLADLQINSMNKKPRNRFLNALLSDIQENINIKTRHVDYLMITGDIAFSGLETDYGIAYQFLHNLEQILEISRDNIYIIIGNHDVDRTKLSRTTKRLLLILREGLEPLEDVLVNEDDVAALLSRMHEALRFTSLYGPGRNKAQTIKDHYLTKEFLIDTSWDRLTMVGGGFNFRCVGLNSALLSMDDQDYGKLRIGGLQKAHLTSLAKSSTDEFVMVMSHHPFSEGWLADESFYNSWLSNRAHVHLHGHMHKGGSLPHPSKDSMDSTIRIHSGHSFDETFGVSYRYNYSELWRRDDSSIVLRVWPRRWSDEVAGFIAEKLPWTYKPYAEYQLPLRLTPALSRHRNIVQLDMQNIEAAVRGAKMPTEKTRRRETISLLKKYIAQVASGELSADASLLISWLQELQQIER